MKWILLVTWLTQNQPPQSYQTEFASKEACDLARNALIAEHRSMAGQTTSRVDWDSWDKPSVEATISKRYRGN